MVSLLPFLVAISGFSAVLIGDSGMPFRLDLRLYNWLAKV